MAKIYIVTEGDYSDYRIVGVFSSKERADAVLASYSNNSGVVEEYDLDSIKVCDKVNKYWFYFDLNGKLEDESIAQSSLSDICEGMKNNVFRSIKGVGVEVFESDRDKAFKIACDLRAEYLAELHGV